MIKKLTIEKINNIKLKYLDILMEETDTNLYVFDIYYNDISTNLQWNISNFIKLTYNNTLRHFITKYTENFVFKIEDAIGEHTVTEHIFLNVMDNLLNKYSNLIGTSKLQIENKDDESISTTANNQYDINTENKEALQSITNKTYYKEKHITINGGTTGDVLYWFFTTATEFTILNMTYITNSNNTTTFSIQDNKSTPTVYYDNVTASSSITSINEETELNIVNDDDTKLINISLNSTFTGLLHITIQYTDDLF